MHIDGIIIPAHTQKELVIGAFRTNNLSSHAIIQVTDTTIDPLIQNKISNGSENHFFVSSIKYGPILALMQGVFSGYFLHNFEIGSIPKSIRM